MSVVCSSEVAPNFAPLAVMEGIETLLESLKSIRYTLPPHHQPFYAGFWWLMRWYVRLPENNQVAETMAAKKSSSITVWS